MTTTFTGAVLIGGYSRRMGRDKAGLVLDGRTMLQRQVQLLRSLKASPIFAVGRPEQRESVREATFMPDAPDATGPLAGLLAAVGASETSHVVVLAVDMPFISARMLASLRDRCTYRVGCVAFDGTKFEPLAAIYPAGALKALRSYARSGRRDLQGWIADAIQRFEMQPYNLSLSERSEFFNCNSPESWMQVSNAARDAAAVS